MRKVILSLELFESEGEVPDEGTISCLLKRKKIMILKLTFLRANFSFCPWSVVILAILSSIESLLVQFVV